MVKRSNDHIFHSVEELYIFVQMSAAPTLSSKKFLNFKWEFLSKFLPDSPQIRPSYFPINTLLFFMVKWEKMGGENNLPQLSKKNSSQRVQQEIDIKNTYEIHSKIDKRSTLF
ncbi:hypothetical protein AABB24_017284 [Solanum stoloniferum]|uniref:Translocon at the inner envelope membrane of chloroplasts 214 n=1 Tax=Solanum stoloniferum TaxID=62892 RepID=A0ABD2TJR7_9SOLN